MKKLSLILTAALFAACAQQQGTQPLLEQLKQTAESGRFYYCHQDDLMYGHSWRLEEADGDFSRSDVFDVCGEYPSMLGYDLGGIELGSDKNLDGNSFRQMRQAAAWLHDKGGIITFSWHPRNPLTGGDAWDVSSDKVVESILPGGEKHDEFMVWLQRAADYIQSYGFPLIFRPWHENSGSWFWWGAGLCTPEQFKQLWVMTYDYFVKERGIDNLVWAYSPNGVVDAEKYMLTYPGDEYVDIMGFDYYHGHSANFTEGMRSQMETILPLAKEHGKVMAVCETGSEGISNPKWWTEELLPSVEGFPVAYVLTWRNAWDRPQHFFGPWKGAACEQDFVEFCNNERTIFVK